MTTRTQEIVVIISSPVEGKEHIAYRVEMGKKQMIDFILKSSYCLEVFSRFLAERCEEELLDPDTCAANLIFPGAETMSAEIWPELPHDLLRVRAGMEMIDLAHGEFLLH